MSLDGLDRRSPAARCGSVVREKVRCRRAFSVVSRSRSAYGALRDLAKNYRRQVVKKGYKDVVDRLERDCFFHFNCASQNLEGHFLIKNLPKWLNPKENPFWPFPFPSSSQAFFSANNRQGSLQPLRHIVVPGRQSKYLSHMAHDTTATHN